jgi:hypothetical protein
MRPTPPECAAIEARPARQSGPWHRAFAFPVFLAAALIVLNVLTVRGRFNDPDLWWHLRVGQVIADTHTVPHTDLFSHTTNNHEWTAHEWLAQASIYGAWRWGGYSGLMLWMCCAASAISILLYLLCALYSGNPKVALAGALLGWLFSTVGVAVRPLMLGHLCLVVELLLLYLGMTRRRAWLWGLPPLFALWVNLHGSYFAGLLLLAAIAVAAHFELRAGALSATKSPARRTLVAASAASVAALLLNPSGVRPLLYPLNVFTAQGHAVAVTEEWAPLTISDERGMALFAIAGLLFLAILVGKAALRLDELLLFALALGMALLHIRMLFVFGIVVAPIAARLLAPLWTERSGERDHPAVNAALIGVAALIVFAAFPSRDELAAQVQRGNPTGAVNFVRQARLAGPMLNDYTWGGYLIWALPEHKVFIDGRADVYEWTGVFGEYARWANLQEPPERLLDKYRVQFCLLRRNAPMALLLSYVPGWERAYADEQSAVFVRESR